jgi:uncharacterized membrane protein (UPF0127 family)
MVGLGSILVPLALAYILFALPTPKSNTLTIQATTTMNVLPSTKRATTATLDPADIILNWYAPLTPLLLGGQHLQASIADTEPERERGLSGTPYLPPGIVKLFEFDTVSKWTFWMKDMLYPIDIIWLDDQKRIVHIESNIAPSTYPNTFAPPVPAKYVIETEAGFTAAKKISVGTKGEW